MHRTAASIAAACVLAGCAATPAKTEAPSVSACDGQRVGSEKLESLTVGSDPEWGRQVVSLGFEGLRHVPLSMVKSAIGTRVGAPLEEEQLGRDVTALDALEAFDSVSVQTETMRRGVGVRFVLSERRKVDGVEYQ